MRLALLYLSTYRTLYFKYKNRYRLQVYTTLYILDEKKNICNWPNLKYTMHFIFQVEKQISITNILYILYFGQKNKYLQLARSQIYAWLYILRRKTGICNQSDCKYMSNFIFQIKKQMFISDQVSGICPTSYFGSKIRYLQLVRFQVYVKLYILDSKIGAWNYWLQINIVFYILNEKISISCKYTLYFKFWMGK